MAATDLVRARGTSLAAKMRRRQWVLGAGVTVLVALLNTAGLLDGLELPTQDWRARMFAGSSPGPSPDIAIVVIDDQATRTVQRWPWDRVHLADAVRELTRAGAGVIALDILLDEAQRPRLEEAPDTPGGSWLVRDDDELAAAIGASGAVVLALDMSLGESAVPVPATAGAPASEASAAYRLSVGQVLDRLTWGPEPIDLEDAGTRARLAAELLPDSERAATTGPAHDLIWLRLDQAGTLLAKGAASTIAVPDDAHRWPATTAPSPPVAAIARGAARLATVTLGGHDPDGVVRRIPLWVRFRDRLYPTLGLAAVAQHWRVKSEGIRIEDGQTLVVAPTADPAAAPNGGLSMLRSRLSAGDFDALHYITWPRAEADWRRQFGDTAQADAEISIGFVLEPARLSHAVRRNVSTLDNLTDAAAHLDLLSIDGYAQRGAEMEGLHPGDAAWGGLYAAQRQVWEKAAREAADSLAAMGNPDPASLTPENAAVVANTRDISLGIPALLKECDAGVGRIARARDILHQRLAGKICFVGWTATGAIADFPATAIHPRTPGVHVHAAVANALLTGYTRVPAPRWSDVLAIVALGLCGTAVSVHARVLVSPAAAGALIVGWFFVSGWALWDHARLIATVAAPSLAVGLSWAGVLMHRLFVEQRTRRRTEERFRSYVSPAVVEILVNNPSLSSMAPQERELTVMFTDLAGFTTTAERLGSVRTAQLLGTYLGAMTRILQSHAATLDKYLGDGIMAFWGAPLADQGHAEHACRAALEMLGTLDRMNAAGAFGDGGPLGMRIGLAAGELMVGDFGNPPRNSSYTVLGDPSNLAARLESANRFFGTRILASGRVRELADPGAAAGTPRSRHAFLWRPIGRVVVKGKAAYAEVYELLGIGEGADGRAAGNASAREAALVHPPTGGGRTEAWIALTEQAFGAYIDGDFELAVRLLDRLTGEFGDAKLAEVYRASMDAWRARPDWLRPGVFDGTVWLSEK